MMKLKPIDSLRNAQRLRPKHLSLNKIIPNMLTVSALCCGLTAIRFATEGKWELVVLAILAAAILDNLDGRIARLIGGTSGFGAQLDSLCDVVSFGVVPALVMYFWGLQDLGRLGWISALLFVVCAAVRLARFNLQSTDPDLPAYAYNYFSGVPTPAAAGLALTPLILGFQFGEDIFRHPGAIAVWLIFIAALMVSPIPTYSLKKVKIQQHYVPLMLVGVGLIAGALFAEPWLTLGLLALVYLSLIPVSYHSYYQLKEDAEKSGANSSAANDLDIDDEDF